MALQAKFLRTGKGGTLAVYEVRGTSTELANFVSANYTTKDQVPAFSSNADGVAILDNNGNKSPLLFTSYPMPGRNSWHPLYQTQSGKNKGTWSLDKDALNFDILVAKSMGSDLGQAIANESAKRYADSTPVSSSTATLLTDDEDVVDEEDFTTVASEDATMDVEETSTAKPKANK
jgi:hypothetical protein